MHLSCPPLYASYGLMIASKGTQGRSLNKTKYFPIKGYRVPKHDTYPKKDQMIPKNSPLTGYVTTLKAIPSNSAKRD